MINSIVKNGRPTAKAAGLPQTLIEADLEQTERILQKTLTPYHARFAGLVKHLNHYRGKRLRPTLLLLIAHACGKAAPAHHTLAAVVEMIHTATLVHDDVLDEAGTRRHVRTVNANWGNKTSILLGDLLFTNAFHLSSTVGDARACEWIGEATNRVCAGELHQTMERGNLDLSETEYFAIVEGKTAALTECCGRLGAFYAGADLELVQQMADFGRNLGIAFQIADDVLDLTGNESATGKTLGTDMAQRKLTLPLIFLFERLSSADADGIRRLLAPENDDYRGVFAALRETGALESAQRRADDYAGKALASLNDLPASAYRSMLKSISGWAVRRET